LHSKLVVYGVVLGVALGAGVALGCSRSPAEGTLNEATAFVESSSVASIAWSVDPNGRVRAAVKAPDGELLKENVSGSMEWRGGTAPKTVALAQDKQSGVLVAAGPKLDADLTQVDYTVSVRGAPMSGTLFLPRGGTSELAGSAAAPPPVVVPEGKKGPHGGPIEVAGKDRLEIVASRKGEVRVYVLDANLQAVPVGARTIQLGVGGASPEVVVLSPAPSGLYLVGHWKVRGEPARITLEERDGDEVVVVIVGHKPGAIVVATGAAEPPPVTVVIVEEFEPRHEDVDEDDEDDDDHRGHGKGVKVNVNGGKGGKWKVKVK
jgi:hypothetical protein